MGTDNLRYCPLCGGNVSLKIVGKYIRAERFFIICHTCGMTYENGYSIQDLVANWNKRYEPHSPGGAYVPAGNERLKHD